MSSTSFSNLSIWVKMVSRSSMGVSSIFSLSSAIFSFCSLADSWICCLIWLVRSRSASLSRFSISGETALTFSTSGWMSFMSRVDLSPNSDFSNLLKFNIFIIFLFVLSPVVLSLSCFVLFWAHFRCKVTYFIAIISMNTQFFVFFLSERLCIFPFFIRRLCLFLFFISTLVYTSLFYQKVVYISLVCLKKRLGTAGIGCPDADAFSDGGCNTVDAHGLCDAFCRDVGSIKNDGEGDERKP